MKDFGMEIIEVNRNLSEENSIVTEYERKFRNRNMPIFHLIGKFK